MSSIEKISIAIPVFNEETVLPELIKRITEVIDTLPNGPHEVVLVDDGSTDQTLAILTEAAKHNDRIKVIKLSRNFGQQPAYAAALDYVTGDAVVLMDGDLQDPPEQIPSMLEKLNEGFDVVYAIRVKRKENFLKRTCYRLYYRLLKWLSRTPLPTDSGDFSILRKPVIDVLRQSSDRHRYLRGIRSWVGFKQVGLEIERDARAAGTPKYNLRGLMKLAMDGVFSFSLLPLRFAAYLGGLTILFAIGFSIYAVLVKYYGDAGDAPTGFTAVYILLSFFAGVQLLFLGILGEYIGRIFEEVKGRPPYIVQQVITSSDSWTQNTQSTTDSSTTGTGGGEAANASS